MKASATLVDSGGDASGSGGMMGPARDFRQRGTLRSSKTLSFDMAPNISPFARPEI